MFFIDSERLGYNMILLFIGPIIGIIAAIVAVAAVTVAIGAYMGGDSEDE